MQLYNLQQVLNIVPVSRMTIFRLVKKKKFPKPIKVGSRIFWKSSTIEQWLRNKK